LEVMQQSRVLAQGKVDLRLGEIDQVLVCGDRDRLKQVLINLISNAIKYTPQGGEVVMGVGKNNDQAYITVQDNGPGISTEELPHIFERFYRIEKSRTRSADGKGFGLGLSIAYWIVKHHDGEITVESEEGKGTRFCVWLPLAVGDCQPES
jgi:signal transduction histidine kinase